MTLKFSTLSLILFFLVSGISAQSEVTPSKRKYQVSLMYGKVFSTSYKQKIPSIGEINVVNYKFGFGSASSNALVLLVHRNLSNLWQVGLGYGLENFDLIGNSMPLFIDVRRSFVKNQRKSMFAYGSAGLLISGDIFAKGHLFNLGGGFIPKIGKKSKWSVLLGMEYRNINFISSSFTLDGSRPSKGYHFGSKLSIAHTF